MMAERTLPAMPQAKSNVAALDEIARDIIDATVGAVAPERIVLFGSRARRDGGPDSALEPLDRLALADQVGALARRVSGLMASAT
jgi:hypothetical protein